MHPVFVGFAPQQLVTRTKITNADKSHPVASSLLSSLSFLSLSLQPERQTAKKRSLAHGITLSSSLSLQVRHFSGKDSSGLWVCVHDHRSHDWSPRSRPTRLLVWPNLKTGLVLSYLSLEFLD